MEAVKVRNNKRGFSGSSAHETVPAPSSVLHPTGACPQTRRTRRCSSRRRAASPGASPARRERAFRVWGRRTLRGTENAAHQVVGHGLGADVERQAGQLGGVLELSVERAQVHRQEVVLGEGRTLRTNVDGSSKAAGIQKKMQQR